MIVSRCTNGVIEMIALPKQDEPSVGWFLWIDAAVIPIGDHVPIIMTKRKAVDQLGLTGEKISSREEKTIGIEMMIPRYLNRSRAAVTGSVFSAVMLDCSIRCVLRFFSVPGVRARTTQRCRNPRMVL